MEIPLVRWSDLPDSPWCLGDNMIDRAGKYCLNKEEPFISPVGPYNMFVYFTCILSYEKYLTVRLGDITGPHMEHFLGVPYGFCYWELYEFIWVI